MRYSIILTHTADGDIRVSVALVPQYTLVTRDREEAIRQTCQDLAEIVSHTEIVQVEVPGGEVQPPVNGVIPPLSGRLETPWEWFGYYRDDPDVDRIYDEIERYRDSTTTPD